MGVSSFRLVVFFLWSFRSATSGTFVPPRPPRRQGPLRSPPPRKKTRGGGSPPCAGSGRVGGPVAGGRVGSVFGPVSLVWSGLLGVCRGCSLALFRVCSGGFCGAAFGPLSGGPVGWFRPGAVVPPLPAVAVRVCRGRPVPLVCGGGSLRAVVGSPPAGPPRFLCGAPGPGWFRGVGSGLSVPAAVSLRLARSGGGSRRCRRAVRPGRLGWPLFPSPSSRPGWRPAARPGRPGRPAPACCWWRVPRGWPPSTAAAAPGCSA